jgi:3-hydroxybutyryl-CoA dehydrogenase
MLPDLIYSRHLLADRAEIDMNANEIKRIGVVGAGTMGRGIAQLLAIKGLSVVLVDRENTILRIALERVLELTKPELREEVEGRIAVSIIPERLKVCDMVIEAVYENEEVKLETFKIIGEICRKDAIIASNTSTISISRLSTSIPNPGHFIGMHFMNPPAVMQLVEVVRGEKTADATVRLTTGLAKRLGKVPVVIHDTPGFVANRLLFAQVGEALRLLESGAAGKEDIDTILKLGLNHPLGPFELADFIGLDVSLSIMAYLRETLADERYRPGNILEQLVREGKLGRKTGEGFYRYS